MLSGFLAKVRPTGSPSQERKRRTIGRSKAERGRVEPALVMRMALTQTFERKQATPSSPVSLEACDGVSRTRGFKATCGAQPRRNRLLVHSDKKNEGACSVALALEIAGAHLSRTLRLVRTHEKTPAMAAAQRFKRAGRARIHSARTFAKLSSCAPWRAMTTRSIPSGTRSGHMRKQARQRRLMRLR